jgi:hypothetical protein
MKAEMDKNCNILLKPENNFEKCILELAKMISKDSSAVEKLIEQMPMADMVYCKTTLLYLVKMFKDKIGYIPVV